MSRPSVKAWMTRSGTLSSAASPISAFRCSSEECTPPVDTSPIRCTRSAPRQRRAQRVVLASVPSRTAASIRARSCGTIAPAPRLRCPTSELPICPSGRPTASPFAVSVVCGCSAHSPSNTGVSASETAFPGPSGASPQPSSTTRQTRGDGHAAAAASTIAREVVGVEARAADQRAVDVGQRQQLGGVVGLARAAVEDPHRRRRPRRSRRPARGRTRSPPGPARAWRSCRCRSPRPARRR